MDTYKKLIEYEGMLKDGVISVEEFQKLKNMLYSSKMTELGIQDEAEFEDYIKKDTFKEAILMLENNTVASYKDAISLLESLKGWGNSNEVIAQCKTDLAELEQIAEKERLDKEKDNKLEAARKKIESQSLSACQEAINELKELGSWKDADSLLESASAKLPELIKIEEGKKAEAEKRKKKISKYIALAIAAIVVVIALVAIINKVIIPGNNYKKALALEEAKQYEEAITIYTDLGDYKESREHITSCKYGIATDLKTAGKYKEGAEAFVALGNYKDSKELANECKYSYATELKDAEKYNEAYEYFSTLGSYKDSKDLANECKYIIASNLKSQKNYKEAAETFAALGNYKDSKDLANECKYNYALQLSSSDQYEAASKVFKELGKYKDSAEQAEAMLKKAEIAPFLNKSVGDTLTFGYYEQDNNKSNGKEPIEWLVIETKKDRILLVSKKVLDAKQLENDSSKTKATWLDSKLNNWLNKDFVKDAFNDKELKRILSNVDPSYDRVFLLSWEEAKPYVENGGILAHADATEYSKDIDHDANDWWVRSLFYVDTVKELRGYVVDGSHISMEGAWGFFGVRPAIWIDISE